jgi:hypothetical protein
VLVLSSAGVLWHVTPVVWLLAAVCLTVWPVTIGIAVTLGDPELELRQFLASRQARRTPEQAGVPTFADQRQLDQPESDHSIDV